VQLTKASFPAFKNVDCTCGRALKKGFLFRPKPVTAFLCLSTPSASATAYLAMINTGQLSLALAIWFRDSIDVL
jgi:hypothetical protein